MKNKKSGSLQLSCQCNKHDEIWCCLSNIVQVSLGLPKKLKKTWHGNKCMTTRSWGNEKTDIVAKKRSAETFTGLELVFGIFL